MEVDAGRSLGQEYSPEKKMATHSTVLPGKSHGQESGGLSPWGCKRAGHDLVSEQQQMCIVY